MPGRVEAVARRTSWGVGSSAPLAPAVTARTLPEMLGAMAEVSIMPPLVWRRRPQASGISFFCRPTQERK